MDKLLDLMPRLMTSKPAEVVKILQTMLRQSTFLHLPLPEQVGDFVIPLQVKSGQTELLPWMVFHLGSSWARAFSLIGSHMPTCWIRRQKGKGYVLLSRDDLALESLYFLFVYRSTRPRLPSLSQRASQTTLCGLRPGWWWPWMLTQPWNMCGIPRTL